MTTATAGSPWARADDAKAACLEAHEQGQRLRNEGHLRAAREVLAACAQPTCPPLVEQHCSKLIVLATAELPSVLIVARDARGQEALDVRVFVDGVLVRQRLDGLPLALDPGEHVVGVERRGARPLEQRLLLRPLEKNRRLVVEFQADHEPPAPAASRDHTASVLSYVLGGVALLATSSFAYFALTGKSLERDLARSCSPSCTDDQIRPVARDYLVADISLGAALLATGAALWVFFSHRHPIQANGIGMIPVAGGATATAPAGL